MKCSKCLKMSFCPYIHYFNHDTSVGCIEFIDTESPTCISNTLHIEENANSKKLTPLEALDIIRRTTDLDVPNELNGYTNELNIIESTLKAFKIIKEYDDFNVYEVQGSYYLSTGKNYRNQIPITKEEYDLLSEVLL